MIAIENMEGPVSTRTIFSLRDQLFWGATGLAIAAGTLALGESVRPDEQLRFVTRGLAFAGACITVPISIELCFRWIMTWVRGINSFIHCNDHDAAQRFVSDLTPYFSRKAMYLFGVLWATIAAMLTLSYSEHVKALATSPKLMSFIALFVAEVLAGAALTAMFGFARAVWRTGTSQGCVVRLSRDNFGVLSTGNLMFKCWGVALFLWMLYMIPLLEIMHRGAIVLTFQQSPVIFALAAPAMVFILSAFVTCQVPLHRRMLESKRATVERFRTLIDESMPSTVNSTSDEVIRKIQFFESRLLIAQQLPEWPSTLLVTAGTVGFSVMSAILPSYLSPAFKLVAGQIFRISSGTS